MDQDGVEQAGALLEPPAATRASARAAAAQVNIRMAMGRGRSACRRPTSAVTAAAMEY